MADLTLEEEVLIREYERMCTEIRTVEANNEKVITFGLSIITAAFAIGAAQHVSTVFLLIPIALVGVFLYAALLYTYVFSMGGYKRYLEDRLNEHIGKKVLLWERMVAIRQKRNIIRPALVAIYLLIGIVLGAVSEAYIEIDFGLWLMLLIALITVALLVVLLFVLQRMWGMSDLVYMAAIEESRVAVARPS